MTDSGTTVHTKYTKKNQGINVKSIIANPLNKILKEDSLPLRRLLQYKAMFGCSELWLVLIDCIIGDAQNEHEHPHDKMVKKFANLMTFVSL